MSAIDPNKCLPPELVIESVDDILYRIGLSFDSLRDRPKRKLIDHPLVAFVMVSIFMTERIITVSLSDGFDVPFKALGSVGHFIGVRRLFDLFFILNAVFNLSSQLLYYYNYRNGIKPTFLRVFQMMSGLVSPKSLGLTDEQQIRKLVKITQWLLSLMFLNNNIAIPIVGIVLDPTIYLIYGYPFEALVFGIPNGILLAIWARYFWNHVTYFF